MKLIYSLAVMSLMFVGANAMADKLDRSVNSGEAQLSVGKASPNYVKAPVLPAPIQPIKKPVKPVANYVIAKLPKL